MDFSFHPEAEEEFVAAVAYYEECEPILGLDFSREVYATIQNALEYPAMWPEIGAEVRRCLVHRFPYGVLYSVEPHGLFILAVMHLHRDPDYWKHRQRTGRTRL
jgi:ParE toxin of type II toxin-antitoxin system, parDE